MSFIDFKVDVDERKVDLRLDQLPTRLRTALKPAITRLTDQLLARVLSAEPRRTGALQRATKAYVDDKENAVRGRVRIGPEAGKGARNVAAAALEYGAHRLVHVKEHESHVSRVFGRVANKELEIVDAYTRRANIIAERFLRGPLQAMRPTIQAELERVVNDTVREK
jgi:hypothetical protein